MPGKNIAVLCCGIVVVVGVFAVVSAEKTERDNPDTPSADTAASHQRIERQVTSHPTPLAASGVSPSRNFPSLNKLMSAADPSSARTAWREARKELLNYSEGSYAVEALEAALASGHDTTFDTTLRVSVGGELQGAPSIRVYLLDLLAQLDSAAAAQYARIILQSSPSSDEWAIALRNYTWGVDNAASDPFLRGKVLELLTNDTWISQPTSGFLEAFDFVPYTRDPSLIAPLVTLSKPEQPHSIRRAAFFALARFHSQNTTAGLQGVSTSEALESFSPVRADAMSRADFTRAEDITLVRSYLLSQTVEPKEYAIFADAFPQGGQFAGPALATRFQPESFSVLAKRDAQALSIIEVWMQDPLLEPRRSDLARIYERLLRLRESAVVGGYL